MDNFTHTLIGVVIGETAARTTASDPAGVPSSQRRALFVTVGGIASNVPDLDLFASVLSHDKLRYLLEHRGYTHTLLGILIQAILMFGAVHAWSRWRRWPLSSRDHWQVLALILVSLLIHLGMDFTNEYGVHPFWPFDNRWFYGDSIFIWEPLLWTAAAPLVFLLRTRIARALVAALLVAAVAVCFTSGLVPLPFAILMAALTLALLVIGRQATPRIAMMSSVATWLGITAVFVVCRNLVAHELREFASQHLPQRHVLDYVLTPMPANPVCWDVILPSLEDDHYLIRHGTWSLAPHWLPAGRCPGRHLFQHITAPRVAVEDAESAQVWWRGEIRMPRNQIAHLAATDCEAAAFLRFARAPWAIVDEQRSVIGDLRYDREAELGFAEIELDENEALGQLARCPSGLPPWTPPRQDLIAAGADDLRH